jgi:hypothetical protein
MTEVVVVLQPHNPTPPWQLHLNDERPEGVLVPPIVPRRQVEQKDQTRDMWVKSGSQRSKQQPVIVGLRLRSLQKQASLALAKAIPTNAEQVQLSSHTHHHQNKRLGRKLSGLQKVMIQAKMSVTTFETKKVMT